MLEQDSTRKRRLIAVAVLTGLLTYVWYSDPNAGTGYLPCTFHWLTGLHCPGCGGQRALHALLHGHFAQAAGLNALVLPGLPLLAVALMTKQLAWRTEGHNPDALTKRWTAVFLVAALIYGIVRNLPGEAFDMLRP